MEASRKTKKPARRWPTYAAALAVIALLLAAAGSCASHSRTGKPAPVASGGVIDLTEWRWDEQGTVPLDGEWSFRWLERGEGSSYRDTTMTVPGTWGANDTGDGDRLDDIGYGIYRLTILHRVQNEILALRLPNISTSYELYVGDKLLKSRGRPDVNAELTIPRQVPTTVHFETQGARTELKLVVANYDHRYGGVRWSIVMGTSEQIQRLQLQHAAQELIIMGCLLMIGFYHLGLYVLRRKETANIMFALLCLCVGFRMGLIGEGFIPRWLSGMSWESAIRLEYVAFVLAAWAGFSFFRMMYPQEIKRLWFKLASVVGAALLVVALVTPTLWFTSSLIVNQIYVLLLSARVLVGLVLAAHRKREGAVLALIGTAGLVVAIVNDILFYNGWSESIDLLPLGLLFLVFMNSFIIWLRFSLTYDRAERMSAQLAEWNSTLEERIEERTEELKRSYATVEEARSELERMESSRTRLVSNISHDLRTPITLLRGYLEALRDNVISEPEQRDKTIRSMLAKVEGLNSLIQNLFDLSMLEARKLELARQNIPLAHWKDRITEQYGLEMQSKGIVFRCELERESDAEAIVSADIRQMDRVFANLLYNAIRFTPEGGTIVLSMRTKPESGEVEIRVADSGPGIDPCDLPHIFDRYYRKDGPRSSGSGGSGLGLAITKEIVELHGGRIDVRNSDSGGCVFRIALPAAS
ncbi:ATP-binding protein [Cohnella hongkongensis]|uniref:histidine kinase n=1 Tax=Cohnella hongkongensis TaxID=178337 RepID=A0ABV9F8L3_9BACL